ncbi:hypothetical protein CTRI78_v008202 [Colletotrichum trifolii]|uniref:Integral membrane protein n=1 Tax=Colletotrichum trifolii TaxID=5466 RepID=A0A4R8QWY7_COLTR|nr:hypothetical protein CTRI78_v008202 [Colletotrichum trifolii]
MASSLTLTTLRLAPLLSSTCTLLFAHDQHFFLTLLNRPETRKQSTNLIPTYFRLFFRQGVVVVLGFITISTATAIANLYTSPANLRANRTYWWYAAGGLQSLAHLAYVPFVAPHVQTLVDAKEDMNPNDVLDSWLTVNFRRFLTTDLGAWIAFGVAALGSVRAV